MGIVECFIKLFRHNPQSFNQPAVSSSEYGFTLIELLMTLTIASILLSLAVPSFRGHTGDNQLRNNINNISNAIQFTRSQAIRLKRDVTICASSDQNNCSNSNVWESGWVVAYIDSSDSRVILKVHDALEAGTLRSGGLTSASQLTFARNGALAQGEQAGTFTSCDNRGDEDARALIVNNLGFVHVAYDQDDNGVQNDHSGSDVICPS